MQFDDRGTNWEGCLSEGGGIPGAPDDPSFGILGPLVTQRTLLLRSWDLSGPWLLFS